MSGLVKGKTKQLNSFDEPHKSSFKRISAIGMRKCSACKCLKSMDQYEAIFVNNKCVSPKTCLCCRTRRIEYYNNFESKRSRLEAQSLDSNSVKRVKLERDGANSEQILTRNRTLLQTHKAIADLSKRSGYIDCEKGTDSNLPLDTSMNLPTHQISSYNSASESSNRNNVVQVEKPFEVIAHSYTPTVKTDVTPLIVRNNTSVIKNERSIDNDTSLFIIVEESQEDTEVVNINEQKQGDSLCENRVNSPIGVIANNKNENKTNHIPKINCCPEIVGASLDTEGDVILKTGWLQSLFLGTGYVDRLKYVWQCIRQLVPAIQSSFHAQSEDLYAHENEPPLQTTDWDGDEDDVSDNSFICDINDEQLMKHVEKSLPSEQPINSLDIMSFFKFILEKKVKEAASFLVKALSQGLTPESIIETIIRFYYSHSTLS